MMGRATKRLLCPVLGVAACVACAPPAAAPDGPARPTSPGQKGSQILPLTAEPFSYAVATLGELALLGRGSGLLVYRLPRSGDPQELGSIELGGEVRDIRLDGKTAYAAVRGAGLVVVDCSTPQQPALLSRLEMPLVEGVEVSGEQLYVAARTEGIRVFDVSDPHAPRELGRYRTTEAALRVRVQDALAYVAASYAGMRILDVSDPSLIKEVGFATRDSYGQGSAWDVDVSGDRAFSAIPDNGLRQVDVSHPAKAETLSLYRRLFAPVAVVVRAGTAYVADQSAGLRILDVSRKKMKEIAQLSLDDPVLDVVVNDSRLLLALKTRGLAIVDVGRPARPRLVWPVESPPPG